MTLTLCEGEGFAKESLVNTVHESGSRIRRMKGDYSFIRGFIRGWFGGNYRPRILATNVQCRENVISVKIA